MDLNKQFDRMAKDERAVSLASDALSHFDDDFPKSLKKAIACRPEQRRFFDVMVSAFAQWHFGHTNAPLGIVVDGATGQGKSCMAAMLARFAALKGRRPGYLSTAVMELEMTGQFEDPNRRTGVDYLAKSRDTEIFVIDDFAGERLKHVQHTLVGLIDDRVNREVFTVMTTNLEKPAVLAHIGEREESRLKRFVWVHIPPDAIQDLRESKR